MSLDEAIAALEASRAQLRVTMRPPRPEPAAAGSKRGAASGLVQRGRVLWRYLRQTGCHVPAIKLATDAVQRWWQRHPWSGAVQAALPLNEALVPVVRRYPLAAVAVAAAGGAALVVARPWRWQVVTRQLRWMRREALSGVLSLVTGPLGQALIASLLAGAATQAARGAERQPPPRQEPRPATDDGR